MCTFDFWWDRSSEFVNKPTKLLTDGNFTPLFYNLQFSISMQKIESQILPHSKLTGARSGLPMSEDFSCNDWSASRLLLVQHAINATCNFASRRRSLQ